MEALFPFGAALIGFMFGAFAIARVGRWLIGIHSMLGRGPGALLSATFVASGPWVIVVLTVVAVRVASASWAWWAFGGFAAATAFFGVLTVYLWWKAKQREKAHAA